MEKYMNSFAARTIFCVLLLHSTIHTHCRENEKVNLPDGLCVLDKQQSGCKEKSFCFCCLVNNLCYLAMDTCNSECRKPASSGVGASQKQFLLPSHVLTAILLFHI
ncbi:hypothetical protein VPH35_140027 [Triticum aestivum]